MAEYNMQELNLPGEDGKRILYPRMKLYGQVNLETITEKIAYASSFTRGDIIGLMQAITDEIAYQMGQGYSVKIDNLKKIPGKEQLHDPSRLLPTDRLIEVRRLPRVARMDSQSRIGHRLQRTRNTQDLYSKETITHIH